MVNKQPFCKGFARLRVWPLWTRKNLLFDRNGVFLATGKPFFETHDVSPGPAAYIISEGQTGWKLRIKAWEKTNKLKCGKKLCVLPSAFNLTDQDETEAILRAATEHLGEQPKTIFVDTLARNFGPGDENSTKDMSKFISCCDWLRKETGGAVVMAHHTGKEAARGERGNTALRGDCDVMVALTMHGEGAAGIMEVKCSKTEDYEPFVPYFLQAQQVILDSSDLPKLTKPASSLVWSIGNKDKIEADNKEKQTLENKILNLVPAMKPSEANDSNTLTIKR